MAIALVQTSATIKAGSGTSFSAAFPGNVSTGNLLTCVGSGYAGTTSNFAVHDTNNSTSIWTQRVVSATSGNIPTSGFYCKNCTGGTTPTVTFDGGTGTTGGTAWAQEWSGCDATTPFTSGESGSAAASLDGTHTTTAATNSNANSVYVGGFFDDDATNPVTMTLNNPNSTTWTRDADELNGTTAETGLVGHAIVTTSASRTMSVDWTHGGGTANWSMVFMVFQQAAGVTGIPPGLGPDLVMVVDVQSSTPLMGY